MIRFISEETETEKFLIKQNISYFSHKVFVLKNATPLIFNSFNKNISSFGFIMCKIISWKVEKRNFKIKLRNVFKGMNNMGIGFNIENGHKTKKITHTFSHDRIKSINVSINWIRICLFVSLLFYICCGYWGLLI